MPHYPQSKVIPVFFKQGRPLVFGSGEMILGSYESPDGIYYIDTGFVKIYSISDEGDEYIHIIYGHGELFPLSWAYLGVNTRPYFCEAMGEVVAWRISRDTFITKVNTDVALSNAIGVQLAQQFSIYTSRVDNLEYKKADERVAYRLLFLASRFGARLGKTVTIEAPLTHAILANSINLARESVSREMEKLTKRGIIKQANHHIMIINVSALEAIIGDPIEFNF